MWLLKAISLLDFTLWTKRIWPLPYALLILGAPVPSKVEVECSARDYTPPHSSLTSCTATVASPSSPQSSSPSCRCHNIFATLRIKPKSTNSETKMEKHFCRSGALCAQLLPRPHHAASTPRLQGNHHASTPRIHVTPSLPISI